MLTKREVAAADNSPVGAAASLACTNGTWFTKQAAARTTAVGTIAMKRRSPRVSGCRKPTYREVYTAPDSPADEIHLGHRVAH